MKYLAHKRLAEKIHDSGYRKDYIAKCIGKYPSDISHYLSGSQRPDNVTMKLLAVKLNCTIEDIS